VYINQIVSCYNVKAISKVVKAAGDKLLMNKFIRQNFGGGRTLKSFRSWSFGSRFRWNLIEDLRNVGSATRLFFLQQIVFLCDALSFQSSDLVKRDSVSKFSPRGENTSWSVKTSIVSQQKPILWFQVPLKVISL